MPSTPTQKPSIALGLADFKVATTPDPGIWVQVPRSRPFDPATYLAAEGYTFIKTIQGKFSLLHLYCDAQGRNWKMTDHDPRLVKTMFRGQLTEQVKARLLPHAFKA